MKKVKGSITFLLMLVLMGGIICTPVLAADKSEKAEYIYQLSEGQHDYQWSPHYFNYIDGSDGSHWLGWARTFLMTDGNGAEYQTYCCDMDTGVKEGYRYKCLTLEEAVHPLLDEPYYTEAEAAKLRAIINHGYWATTQDKTSSDANPSLQEIREKTGISHLTCGEALLATQLAIWEYGNRGSEITNTYSNTSDSTEDRSKYPLNHELEIANAENTAANIQAVYEYLLALEPESVKQENIVFSDKHFLGWSNTDSEQEKELMIRFSLEKTPSEKDNLILSVTQNGNRIFSGNLFDKENDQLLYNEAEDYFTLRVNSEDLLSPINLELSGTQYLNKDVYLYVSEAKDGKASQNFIGYGEGSVPVSASAKVDLDIEKKLSVPLTAEKYLDGQETDEIFEFVLKDEFGNIVQEVQNKGKKIEFMPLEFTGAGTFSYTVSEVQGEREDIQYDAGIYNVIVRVSLAEDGHTTEVSYLKNGEPVDKIVFHNETKVVDKTDEPEETEKQENDVAAKTGDLSMLQLFAVLSVGSGLIGIVLLNRKYLNRF